MTELSNFKSIPGYEDLYLINKEGKIYSKKRNKLLKPKKNRFVYLKIILYKNGNPKTFSIHRLIALTFIPNPDNLPCVNHKNGIKTDNRVENLEWCTYSQNNKHAWDSGLCENVRSKLKELGKITGKINIKRAQEARKKHLNENLKELFDEIFIRKSKTKDIANKFNLSCQYIGMIKSKRFLKTALNEYFGGSK